MKRTVNTLLISASIATFTLSTGNAETTSPFLVSSSASIIGLAASLSQPRIEPVDDRTISKMIAKIDRHKETRYSKSDDSYTLQMYGILTAEYKPSFGLTLTEDRSHNAIECRFDDEGDLSIPGLSSQKAMIFQTRCNELVTAFNQQIPDPITKRRAAPIPRIQKKSAPKKRKPETIIDKMAASDFTLYWRNTGMYTFYMGGVVQAEYKPGSGLILREDKDENALECHYNEQLGLQVKKKEKSDFRDRCSALMLSFDEQISE